ncbi:myocyte-specific enhancer factor 2C-like isoform X2 [Patiria miniata]|uniref:MADS-box domain-containing protein n=1 Tax=Patiria miniata TaxID=46514 RepID=A0A914BAU7_PATMI|nr:myocyte-specific enhancer factor 2C-like isoform X2 [Patiria miniata]
MGRKKIQISRINDERNRQVTFTKRKFGLMKKAYELSVLCDCEIALIIFNSSNKLFQYASTDMDKVLLKYTEYNEPHESKTNQEIIELLNKKENKGCDSPDQDVEGYNCTLTPRTEAKYSKINEEFDRMMNGNMSRGQAMANNYPNSMPVAIPISEQQQQQHQQQQQQQQAHQHQQMTHIYNNSPPSQPTLVSSPQLMQPPATAPRQSLSPQPPMSRISLSPQPQQQQQQQHHHSPHMRTSLSPQPSMMRNTISPQPPRPASTGNTYLGPPHSSGVMSPISPNSGTNNNLPLKSMNKQQFTHRHGLKVVIPTSRPGLQNNIGISLNQSLATPTVSLTTPSNPHGVIPNYPSALPTGYHTGTEFQLTSADLNQINFNSPSGLTMPNWHTQSTQAGPLTAAIQAAGITGHPLSVSTSSMPVQNSFTTPTSIKCEPLSPPRDRKLNPQMMPNQPSTSPGPADPNGSPQYSDHGGRALVDKDLPPSKRPRISEAWVR